MNVPN